MAATYRIHRVEDTSWLSISAPYARCGAQFGFIFAPGSERGGIRHTSHWQLSHTASTNQRNASFQRLDDAESAQHSLQRPLCLYARPRKNKGMSIISQSPCCAVESSTTDEPPLTAQKPDGGIDATPPAKGAEEEAGIKVEADVGVPTDATAPPKRRRGRPRKVKVEVEAEVLAATDTDSNIPTPEAIDDNASVEPEIGDSDAADVIMSATTADEGGTQQPTDTQQDPIIDTNQESEVNQDDHADIEAEDDVERAGEVEQHDVVDTATEDTVEESQGDVKDDEEEIEVAEVTTIADEPVNNTDEEIESVTKAESAPETDVAAEETEGDDPDDQENVDAPPKSDSKDTGSSEESGSKGPKTFLQMLEEQLASRKTRLPESFYAEEVYSTFDNTKLPEGAKTLMDFYNLPKNFDFKSMVDLSLHGTDALDTLGVYGTSKPQKAEEPVYTGKYPDSFFETIFHYEPEPRRYTTAEGTPEPVAVEQVFYSLKGKRPSDIVPPERQSPVEKIKEDYLMFDVHDYLKHYLTHLNQYNYRVLSSHHKRDDTLNHYLNNEYIQYIPKKFPPEPDHTEKIRAYFMDILPELMDTLVNLIKNDPNKDRTPSPPLHDMDFAPGFKLPDYMQKGYETDDERTSGFEEKDFLRFSSLQGLHDPERHLNYPYADVEPLYQRQLLSTYLDLVKTGELGEPETYKKFKAQAASIRNELYTDRTKLPQEIYGSAGAKEGKTARTPIERTTRLTKVYERGSRKRSVALVYLEPGNGHIIINNRDGYQYVRYCTQRIREMLEPLDVLYMYKKFNIVAVARGGGISGQTGAIRHALARYLTKVLAPKLEPYLSMRDLTKADTRQVERKKTNLRKARKEEHYSKR
ncbi:30S ribosomal protein S9 [Babesia ovata]|uniref:30S ribosomal protein S9 n=1 Tax=Babesia ovata TaxID=189622 RepID=A0A2H6K7M9_9APIC|nr:30S ribosomal protein S9 [Babesia ovata]GBE59003.1 30S ribosomal protein S9 [Babesia ovata]